MNLENIQAQLQNGKRPDCPKCGAKESALAYHVLIEDFVCGKCYIETEQKKKSALKKLILENA